MFLRDCCRPSKPHRSIVKQEATSPMTTTVGHKSRLEINDFGMSGSIIDASNDADFGRARAFNLNIIESGVSMFHACLTVHLLAIAEDWHALGFTFIVLLQKFQDTSHRRGRIAKTTKLHIQRCNWTKCIDVTELGMYIVQSIIGTISPWIQDHTYHALVFAFM